jgi:hypothetical protein
MCWHHNDQVINYNCCKYALVSGLPTKIVVRKNYNRYVQTGIKRKDRTDIILVVEEM